MLGFALLKLLATECKHAPGTARRARETDPPSASPNILTSAGRLVLASLASVSHGPNSPAYFGRPGVVGHKINGCPTDPTQINHITIDVISHVNAKNAHATCRSIHTVPTTLRKQKVLQHRRGREFGIEEHAAASSA